MNNGPDSGKQLNIDPHISISVYYEIQNNSVGRICELLDDGTMDARPECMNENIRKLKAILR